MDFASPGAEIFVPDGTPIDRALSRTTEMGIAAHEDDLEIMSIGGIIKCFGSRDEWYTGVVVTDGAGSPRSGMYADYSDEEMRRVRRYEQKKAAIVGGYSAQVLLDFPSSAVKDAKETVVVDDILQVLDATAPRVVYTHNLADKHATHVAVVLRVVEAIRRMPADRRPEKLYGCEVWRSLDWMLDEDKVVFDCSAHENISEALMGVFDSQIAGGKRYDLAATGRRRSNATFFESHGTDTAAQLAFAMDLTPLMADDAPSIEAYVRDHIDRFREDVASQVRGLLTG